ncbi:hypothetical protein ACIPJK_25930 [Streptomyces roseus]|uniref:hypothetical protein n=1 Tax=Streptomyces roseus TaxID=66430 RepID=UPI00382B037B
MNADEDYEWHDGPNPMVPVAQPYLRDVPLLRAPGRADLLQVLWCPFEHDPDYKPPTALFWRSSAEVTDILAAPPGPFAVEYDGYLPRPCVLAPEVGGWPRWGLTDPVARFCTAYGAKMVPLLTIASSEWDSSNTTWVPYEDRDTASLDGGDATNPPAVQVSRSNRLQLYVCPESPDHPHTDLIQ